MTVPILTANHKRIEQATRLKKIYNTLQNAVSLAETDFDASFDKWNYGNGYDLFDTYLKDYLKYTKIITKFNDIPKESRIKPKKTSTNSYVSVSETSPLVYLDDGSRVLFSKTVSHSALIDINGDKGPNVMYYDVFEILFTKNGEHFGVSEWASKQTRNTIKERCNKQCNPSGTTAYIGTECLTLIKMDGWEIKDDYPCKF